MAGIDANLQRQSERGVEIKRQEEGMAKLSARKAAIQSRLLDPVAYGEGQKDALKPLVVDQVYLVRELAQLEEEWLALQEQLEATG
jgi:ATP-binding cassette, subfamily F, member 3